MEAPLVHQLALSLGERIWNPQQRIAIEDLAWGDGHTVNIARAGTGKTAVLVEGLTYASSIRALVCAFGRWNTKELEAKIRPTNRRARIKSLGGVGYAALQRAFSGKCDVDLDKTRNIVKALIEMKFRSHTAGWRRSAAAELRHFLEYAKNTLNTETVAQLALAAEHRKLTSAARTLPLEILIELAEEAVKQGKLRTDITDYQDQIWLPWALKIELQQHELVVVDEFQDLNAAQIWLVVHSCLPYGRIIAAGDDRQAIMQFRGADVDAIRRTGSAVSAKTILLPISYRVPRAGIRLAQKIVPDIEHAPNAIEGVVDWTEPDVAYDAPRPGDVVISRTNAPLPKLCFHYIRRGLPAKILGKDIGRGLAKFIERTETLTTRDLLSWLRSYEAREREKLMKLDQPDQVEALRDRIATIEVLCEGAWTTREVIERIEILFADIEDARAVITCTTAHKFKGLETQRTFLIHDTFFRARRWSSLGYDPRGEDERDAEDHNETIDAAPESRDWLPASSIEALNILYVSYTRHREELICCGGPEPGYVRT